jgi:putative ABC transport system substrate-binding protein
MRRREFITLLGGAATGWPLRAGAQQADRVWHIGVLMDLAASDPEGKDRIAAFQQTLQQIGWTDGRNVRIDIRWAGDDLNHLKAQAAELVGLMPDVIMAAGNFLLSELQRSTKTIPIVFTTISGPVESGFVASLARPGANITGFQNFELTIAGKYLGLLKEAVPNVSRVGVLMNPDTPVHVALLHTAEAAAQTLGIQVAAIGVRDGAQIEADIATFVNNGKGGLFVLPHPITIQNRDSIIAPAAGHRLPAIYFFRYFAANGGLISYGPDQVDQFRCAADYVNRILKGEKPADLPVQAPTKYQMVINLKTAKALGITVPPALLARADEVIE